MITFIFWTYLALTAVVSVGILLLGLGLREQWGEEKPGAECGALRRDELAQRKVGEPRGFGELPDQRPNVV